MKRSERLQRGGPRHAYVVARAAGAFRGGVLGGAKRGPLPHEIWPRTGKSNRAGAKPDPLTRPARATVIQFRLALHFPADELRSRPRTTSIQLPSRARHGASRRRPCTRANGLGF